ncbi:MAG: hypothetical protein K8F91_19615, partial [Candidatus Obscuribacterales bacterium]|nr:hypothetical protein [Candidatus Obscuribacterales bacterium]
MSENPQKNSQESDQIDEKATERSALNPAVVEKSQTDAQGKAEIENKRTNKHDGSAGGEGPSITIEAIDEHGRKREVSRTVLGTEKDLLPTESEIDLTSTEQDSREDILASGTIGAMARENPVASAGKSMLEATKDPKVRESIKRDLTDVIRNAHQGQAEAQDENFAGGTFKIPDAAQQESRLAEAVQKILQAEIEMTSPAGEQNESDFPIEQALWRVFHPQGSELSDGEIKLFRTAVTEAAGLFVDKVHGDIESFFEENKAKVALALAGATINTGVAIEASKDGATAAGVPAAAAGVVAIL